MGRVLASSAERRLQAFRHELTLDLFTRSGPFWTEIAKLRQTRGIVAEPWRLRVELHTMPVHLPPDVPPKTPFAWEPEDRAPYVRWLRQLDELHDRVIPHDQRVAGIRFRSHDYWRDFLSACAVYDPPSDDLLGFADHVAEGDLPTYVEAVDDAYADWADEEGREPLEMLAPPIRLFADPDALIQAERERHARILDELHDRLAPQGIDLRELASHVEFWYEDDWEDGPRYARTPAIVVEPATTEEDVRHAFRMLAAVQPERARPSKPTRDRLTAAQCAVWYDRHGWSQERIAQCFRWAVQYPPGVKPRSETARQYISEGRTILNPKRPETETWKHELVAADIGDTE
jgi:hypothetical protein